MEIQDYICEIGSRAKKAARVLAYTDTNTKNKALNFMAEALIANSEEIIKENEKDIIIGTQQGLSKSMIDRLLLNEKRIKDMSDGIRKIAELPDPIGQGTKTWKRPSGIQISKIRVPLGVVGIIYEARPNVTADAAALCIKSGNAVILRGGSEALNSNVKIGSLLRKAAFDAGLPDGSVQIINRAEREVVNILLKLNDYIDVLIPRGGKGLIDNVVKNATVPVIQTGVGNCHVYVDSQADLSMAENIVINAKTQRPAVCNAMETLLVHQAVADQLLPSLSEKLFKLGVEIRGCDKTLKIIPEARSATEEDWGREFLDLILAVKVVTSLDEALDHIYRYGTKHSEAIITNNYLNSQRFLSEVDAAAVYVNASTRFTDGGEFGFGGEIGISTQKLHARGPMGLEELTTNKYVIYGRGEIRK